MIRVLCISSAPSRPGARGDEHVPGSRRYAAKISEARAAGNADVAGHAARMRDADADAQMQMQMQM